MAGEPQFQQFTVSHAPSRNHEQFDALPSEQRNLAFYRNEFPCQPDNMKIIDQYSALKGNFDELERNHGYIQWLFPLFEGRGLTNHHASPLSKEEAGKMRKDVIVGLRIICSYRMMLNFFGIHLSDPKSGELERQEWAYQARYAHLQAHPHNYLRITRILKSLGHLGFTRHKIAFADFLRREIESGHLLQCCTAYEKHWAPTLDVTSKNFIWETGETASDREDAAVLTALDRGDPQVENLLYIYLHLVPEKAPPLT